jgi:type IV pilus assembly protein PilM
MFDAVNRPVVGIDVGSSAVKMVSFRTNGDGFRVNAAAMSTIESSDNGKIPSKRAIITAINQCLESSQGAISRSSHFVFGLSGPKKVKVSSFNFTSLTLEEVSQAVVFEAAQVCPFDTRNSVIDYQLIGIDDTGSRLREKKKKIHPNVEGFLAVATKEAISSRQKLAEGALLKCALMDSEALALLNCLKENLTSDEKLPIAVVNVGRYLTTVVILGADGLPFVRDLSHSGADIIDYIAKNRNTSTSDIQQQLFDGMGSADFAVDIGQASKWLILDVAETLTYYSAHHSGNVIKHVYVCGGFSLLDDFIKTMIDGIDSEVSVWNPFSRMHCENNVAGSDIVKKYGPALAVAAGLAMRQV